MGSAWGTAATRLLLVGDDPADGLAVRRALSGRSREAYELDQAPTIADGLSHSRRGRPDIVLLALGPQGDGLGPLFQVKQRAPELPVVVLVRPGDEDLAVHALGEGAHDWLVNADLDHRALERSIRYAMDRRALSAELAAAREQLGKLSLHDDATGLYNHRGFSVLAEQQIRVARRWDTGVLLLVLDIDGLDSINERFGRSAGDRAIEETAQLVRESFRDSDIKARVGGDEFAVLLSGAADGTCEVIDVRLERNLERLNADRDTPLSISGGVAKWDPLSTQSIAELIDHAQHLMHQQKRVPGRVGCPE